MKNLVNALIIIGFALFLIFVLLFCPEDKIYLTPAAIFGGSSLIALAINNKK